MGYGKKIKVGINGFGRIGRQIATILFLQDNNYAELVAINDPSIAIDHMPAVFKSLSSRLQQHDDFEVIKINNTLLSGQKSVTVHAISNPEEIPWANIGVEYVVESTGSFTEMSKAAAHLKGGAKKVIITDISKDAPMYVFGVNEKEYKPEYDIVSSASCTTNYLAPILEVINDRFVILEGHTKIVESAIATQNVDRPSMDTRPAFFKLIPKFTSAADLCLAAGNLLQVLHGSVGNFGGLVPALNTFFTIMDVVQAAEKLFLKIGDNFGIDNGLTMALVKLLSPPAPGIDVPHRASSTNTIPSNAADVEAVGKVLSFPNGKLNGMAFHVPSMDGSVVDLTVRLEVGATLEGIEDAIREKSEGKFKGILGYTEGNDVSGDLVGDSRSSIFNATAGVALNENLFKFIFCFDNERGYGYRVIDLIVHMASVEACG